MISFDRVIVFSLFFLKIVFVSPSSLLNLCIINTFILLIHINPLSFNYSLMIRFFKCGSTGTIYVCHFPLFLSFYVFCTTFDSSYLIDLLELSQTNNNLFFGILKIMSKSLVIRNIVMKIRRTEFEFTLYCNLHFLPKGIFANFQGAGF